MSSPLSWDNWEAGQAPGSEDIVLLTLHFPQLSGVERLIVNHSCFCGGWERPGQVNQSIQQGQGVVETGVGLAGDMLGTHSLSSSRQTLSWGSLSPSACPCMGQSAIGVCPYAHCYCSHLQNLLTLSLSRFSSVLGVAQMPVGSLGMPLGIHSLMA